MPNRHARRAIASTKKKSAQRHDDLLARGERVPTGLAPLKIPREFLVIADAVEEALAEWPQFPPHLDCYRRAAVSTTMLSVITRRTWHVNAGRFMADSGREGGETEMLGWSPERGRREGVLESHAWSVCLLDRVVSSGFQNMRADRVLIFDTSSRYLPRSVELIGGEWKRPVLPLAYGTQRDLRAAGYIYEADAQASETELMFVSQYGDVIEIVARRAMSKYLAAQRESDGRASSRGRPATP